MLKLGNAVLQNVEVTGASIFQESSFSGGLVRFRVDFVYYHNVPDSFYISDWVPREDAQHFIDGVHQTMKAEAERRQFA